MRRVKIIYSEGVKSYGELDISGDKPTITIARVPYDLETFAKTGAEVAVNDDECLKVLLEHGVKARPTGRQMTATITIPPSLRDRMNTAAEKENTTTTRIFNDGADEWLKARGY